MTDLLLKPLCFALKTSLFDFSRGLCLKIKPTKKDIIVFHGINFIKKGLFFFLIFFYESIKKGLEW